MSPEQAHPPSVRVINGKKTFIPLENNPDSLSRLSDLLGIKHVSFHDVYSLDPIIQDDLPRPTHALIFIAPAPVYHQLWASKEERSRHWSNSTTKSPQEHEESHINGVNTNHHSSMTTTSSEVDEDAEAGLKSNITLSGPEAPVMWFKQTIGHACGLMSLLHAIANGMDISQHLDPSSALSKIIQSAGPLTIEPRAKLLYDSPDLETAHMTAAASGDTYAPDPSEPNGMHFITFVKQTDGTLWELEGGNPGGPVKLAHLDHGEDVLSENAVRAGPGRYINVGREMGIAEFSCVALALQ